MARETCAALAPTSQIRELIASIALDRGGSAEEPHGKFVTVRESWPRHRFICLGLRFVVFSMRTCKALLNTL
jgi:hypothetical protein